MRQRQKSVENLIKLLQGNKQIKEALEVSLQKAHEPGIETLEEFYSFLDRLLTHIPTEKELMPSVRKFYYVIGKSPGDILKKDEAFNKWINEFVQSRGDFLDTTESAKCLNTFIQNPQFNINDYVPPPSGWLTYNQFLARQIKPGKRPVAKPSDDSIIVSPVDGVFKGYWPIQQDSTITAKGITYSIAELLNESPYLNKFKEGIFTHSFLSISDYHRYHVPVGGIIREVKRIPATTWIHESKKPDGSIENTDDVGFQFTHTRGYIIIESAVGFVAVILVGMGHISSVILNVDEGTRLVKGEEFGYFAFGGSDIIMLFESDRIKFTAKENTHYKQGEEIAHSLNT